jgi:hypothetical protein
MDFAELHELLQGGAVWIYFASLIVCLVDVAFAVPRSELVQPHMIHDLVADEALHHGFLVMSPQVYRTLLLRILKDRWLPLAQLLMDAQQKPVVVYEQALFNPITLEERESGFALDGVCVMTMDELIRWVLCHGPINPMLQKPIESIDIVVQAGVDLPRVPDMLQSHIESLDAAKTLVGLQSQHDTLLAAHTL